MNRICTTHGNVTFPEMVGTGKVEAKLWENNGKCRIYFKVSYNTCRPADCGFYDVIARKSYIVSSPKSVGRELEAGIEIA